MIPTKNKLNAGVTVVVPCYNEQGAVEETVRNIAKVLDASSRSEDFSFESEMIFVNDGSSDGTLSILLELEK